MRFSVGVCATLLLACSSGTGSAPGAPGSPCSGGCDPDRCVCSDGTTADTSTSCLGGTCSTGGMSECTMRCGGHGGLASVGPAPNVATSAECDAFCNKIASLACGSSKCDRYFWCLVQPGECEASVRAVLACQAQTEMFTCLDGGGWSGTGSCFQQPNLCGGDGGSE
jgi:hypothetical protein